MKNEKNFLLAVIITVVVLYFYPLLIKQFFPQFFTPPEEIQIKGPGSTVGRPQTETAFQSGPKEYANPVTTAPVKTYTIENDLYRVVIASPEADIKRIELKKITDPGTQLPTVLVDVGTQGRGIFYQEGLLLDSVLEGIEESNTAVEFIYSKGNKLTIIKRIELDARMYKISLITEFKNASDKEIFTGYSFVAATGLNEVSGIEDRFRDAMAMFKNGKMYKKNINSLESLRKIEGDIHFAGFKTRYFSLVATPLNGADYFYTQKAAPGSPGAKANVGIGCKQLAIMPQQTVRQEVVLYAGPTDYETMSGLNLGIEAIRGKGFFAGISEMLLMLLRFLYKLLNNYGLAVVVLAIIINLFLAPLTIKSLVSMKEMQSLQPLVEQLRNEHKDNPQKLNKEIMGLYKKHKVNPAGGCLPMLLQMPIFFSLYNVLMRAIELRGASFLWIKNLAAPDAFINLPGEYPLIGSSINILPIIMIAVSFFQQKLTNPAQANDQQKAMAFLMPFFLGFIFYNFPSGLALYFLTNSIFSFAIQLGISKKAKVCS
ncbi:MAG: membrane protein insertase YidC [Candidatus Omnitrophica bacterium]|nr:membrane protein insertase YidC [Candidatus Omnitrophota bacterium]MBU4479686.1 membrane protein insertase YidC [Candidatus Omnitrophota bacterium]MCG2703110.1 membrane protein insertase YidC [Candidatus Omnitrophota bacterium]